MDGLNSRAFDGQIESAKSRVRSAFGSFRRSVSRVCVAFVAYLSCPFRATDVRGWPYTLGGALRLRRVALPWANLFCPFGVERFLDAWPVSALVVLRVPAAAPLPASFPAAFLSRQAVGDGSPPTPPPHPSVRAIRPSAPTTTSEPRHPSSPTRPSDHPQPHPSINVSIHPSSELVFGWTSYDQSGWYACGWCTS